jgi:hypothetical protein
VSVEVRTKKVEKRRHFVLRGPVVLHQAYPDKNSSKRGIPNSDEGDEGDEGRGIHAASPDDRWKMVPISSNAPLRKLKRDASRARGAAFMPLHRATAAEAPDFQRHTTSHAEAG